MLSRDRDIRPLLRARLAQEHAAEARTRIVDEMPICQARARVDVAVVNGELAGYEIKSDMDRLDRLAAQSRFYGRIFDRAIVVCAPRHLAVIRRRLPSWWGLWVVEAAAGRGILLWIDRPGEQNLDARTRERIALLRRDEMAEILQRLTGANVRQMRRTELSTALCDALDDHSASMEVRRCLCARYQ